MITLTRWRSPLTDLLMTSLMLPIGGWAPVIMFRFEWNRLLKAGKHVLCEKPLATKTRDAKAMVKAARKRGLYLMVDFQNRWSPLFLEAKKQIEDGELGELVTGYARLSNTLFVPTKMLAWAGKSGPEWFLLPHIFDLVRWMTGRKKIIEVFARGHKKILKAKAQYPLMTKS